jgi:hypothetical protein
MSHDGYTPGPRQAVADPPAGYVTEAECTRRVDEAVKAEREKNANETKKVIDLLLEIVILFRSMGLKAQADILAAAIRARQEGEG